MPQSFESEKGELETDEATLVFRLDLGFKNSLKLSSRWRIALKGEF